MIVQLEEYRPQIANAWHSVYSGSEKKMGEVEIRMTIVLPSCSNMFDHAAEIHRKIEEAVAGMKWRFDQIGKERKV